MNITDDDRARIERMAQRLAEDCQELGSTCRVMSTECCDVAMADVIHSFRKLLEAWQEGTA